MAPSASTAPAPEPNTTLLDVLATRPEFQTLGQLLNRNGDPAPPYEPPNNETMADMFAQAVARAQGAFAGLEGQGEAQQGENRTDARSGTDVPHVQVNSPTSPPVIRNAPLGGAQSWGFPQTGGTASTSFASVPGTTRPAATDGSHEERGSQGDGASRPRSQQASVEDILDDEDLD